MADHPNPTRVPIVDSHAHLDSDDFSGEVGEIVARAEDFGLVGIVTIGIEPGDWDGCLALAGQHEIVHTALGIHPNSAGQTTDETLARLEALCRNGEGKRKVVGIGETGLDYYREYVPHDVQRRSFSAHLALARELDLPVIIHNRDAHEDILDILKAEGKGTRGVMHSFSGDVEYARRSLDIGYMVSLAGPVTFRKAEDKHMVARYVPLDSLLIETDCPYLTPEPYRGRRNEPAYVAYTARAIAALRGVSFEEVARATTANAARLFSIVPVEAPSAQGGATR
ncbi:MAG TPA: TatD family hydrolase [Chloroflexia bacterium]|nr:TatD family hydrolase [Chloroflexia bacterium]